MRVKINTEVDIDVTDLDPKFVDIEGFAKNEARRIMINEPEFYEFDYEIIEEKYTMTENMKFWLTQLYDNEIEEARGAASNEHLWALGSDGESSLQHEANAEEQREYIKVLETLKEELK